MIIIEPVQIDVGTNKTAVTIHLTFSVNLFIYIYKLNKTGISKILIINSRDGIENLIAL